jgi:hypothetical protein
MIATVDAGATFNYRATLPEYPAEAGWVATLYLNPRAGGTAQAVTASADGSAHLFQAAGVATATWAAGSYGWEVWVERAGERYRVDGGQLLVRPTLIGAAAGIDTRSQAERALEDARAALAAWTPTTRKYTIGGRAMEFNSVAEILQLISHWQVEVKREQAAARMAAGLDARRKVHVRIGRA